jgi:hypothetical protein
MDTLTSFSYLLIGLLLRLAIPITATVVVIYILRRLDKRWQAEAELQPIEAEKIQCWKAKGCSPEQVKNCKAAKSPLSCWQAKRLPNGYLNEDCLSCPVFIEAPVPTLTIETRSL